MSPKRSTEKQIVHELGAFFEPLVSAGRGGPEGVFRFLSDAGLAEEMKGTELGKVVTLFTEEISEPLTILYENLLKDEAELTDIPVVVKAMVDIHDGVKKANDVSFQSSELGAVGDAVIDYLAHEFLESEHYLAFNLFVVLGILDHSRTSGTVEFRPQKIVSLFQDPAGSLLATYNVADSGVAIDADLLSYDLVELFSSIGVTAVADPLDRAAVDAFSSDIPSSITKPKNAEKVADYRQINFPILSLPALSFGMNLLPVPHARTAGGGETTYEGFDGVAIQPYGKFQDGFSTTFGPSDNRKFSTTLSASESDWLVGVTFDENLTPKAVAKSGSTLPTLKAGAQLSNLLGTSGRGQQLVGTQDGTQLSVRELSVSGSVSFENGNLEGALELPSSGRLVIKPQGGFLAKVLPDEVSADFETLVGWSSTEGLYFEAGGTLEVALPMHTSLGPITLKEIYLALTPDTESGALAVEASAAATVAIGPVTGTVDRMGVEAELAFPEDGGNFGPLDLELGFSPPKGVGLSVSAGPVTGSGYLYFDQENERYAGVAQLKVADLSATAIGLITTEMPDGSDGFSMQVIVAGRFPPVQLGFGFTLTGVGGLLGINRKFRKRPLRKVVRNGNLDSVLFPSKETVKNSPKRLISDVRSIFPPRQGSYVFGPMLQIGYGTPTVLKSSLGVVLEIPSFRVAILGRFELKLPNHEAEKPSGMPKQAPWPPIVLNLNVGGIIDIPGKSISMDATLYDSRVLQWTVEGDMALRSSWGEKSRFILSVGGFNPRYTPPKDAPGLRKLDRVKVSLDVPGGQPVVEFTGYFAVTSNTFQVGASVHAEAELGKIRVMGTLGFDALFQFKPFKFIFDFLAQFKLEAPGFEVGFQFDATIKGPTPFNINGKVRVSVGPLNVNKRFDVTIGSEKKAEPLPAASVLPELVEALGRPKNWDAQRPGRGKAAVSLRRPEPSGGPDNGDDSEKPEPVLAHPQGTLTVRQSIVPLEESIEKFGENTPKTHEWFTIESVSVAGSSPENRSVVRGKFPPAKYRKMSDAEKLDAPDVVDLPAGTTVVSAEPLVGGTEQFEPLEVPDVDLPRDVDDPLDDLDLRSDVELENTNATRASFVYEETVVDEGVGVDGEPVETVQGDDVDAAARTHSSEAATSLVEGRVSASGHDRGRFDVGQRDRGEGGGKFSVDSIADTNQEGNS